MTDNTQQQDPTQLEEEGVHDFKGLCLILHMCLDRIKSTTVEDQQLQQQQHPEALTASWATGVEKFLKTGCIGIPKAPISPSQKTQFKVCRLHLGSSCFKTICSKTIHDAFEISSPPL